MTEEAVEATEIGTPEAPEAEATTDAGIETTTPEETTDTPTFTVKIDGKEEEVSLDELLNGYQRQADYTQKTQAIASERQRISQFEALTYALQTNPQQTLAELAKELGVDLSGVQEDLEPEDKRWQQVEKFMASEQQRRANETAQAQIDRELAELHQKAGDFEDEALIRYAVDHGIPVLAEAYKAKAYEDHQSEQLRERNLAQAAKRQDAVVEGGAGRQTNAVVDGGNDKPTIAEAYARARQKLNV